MRVSYSGCAIDGRINRLLNSLMAYYRVWSGCWVQFSWALEGIKNEWNKTSEIKYQHGLDTPTFIHWTILPKYLRQKVREFIATWYTSCIVLIVSAILFFKNVGDFAGFIPLVCLFPNLCFTILLAILHRCGCICHRFTSQSLLAFITLHGNLLWKGEIICVSTLLFCQRGKLWRNNRYLPVLICHPNSCPMIGLRSSLASKAFWSLCCHLLWT